MTLPLPKMDCSPTAYVRREFPCPITEQPLRIAPPRMPPVPSGTFVQDSGEPLLMPCAYNLRERC